MSINTNPRARRKEIQVIISAVVASARPIPMFESLILRVLREGSIQCSETELRRELCDLEDKGIIRLDRVDGAPWIASLAGPAIGVAGGRNIVAGRDPHITISVVVEASHGVRPRPAGNVARADSRPSGRISR